MHRLSGSYYTALEVAEVLGVTRARILQMLAREQMKGVKVGNMWLIPHGELQIHIMDREKECEDVPHS